ncbi:MAG: MFS transporter [Saprospiraceae bacterium]|nr:MFS transporter [Saprospiraceae bacterium]
MLISIGVGITNLIFTYIGLMLIDKAGKKTADVYRFRGLCISLSLVSMAFLQE